MSQNTNNTGATLNGLFRQVYSKEVGELIPDFAILQDRVSFEKGSMLGDYFHVPVVLSDEQGFSYGDGTGAAYNLNSAVAMAMQDAQVRGAELTLQSGISYTAVSRSMQKGTAAVEQAVRLLVERMKASAAKRVEIEMLYGQSGLGIVSAHSGASTTRAYTLSAASWSSGIWAGMENANLDFVAAGSVINTNAPVVITSINVGTKTLNVSGNATDLTAIDAATTPSIFFYGAYGKEMAGLDKILTNTGSLFNIDASVYALWGANTYSAGSAALTMGKILSGVALCVGRGLMEDAAVFVAPDSWNNLNSDLAAQRVFDTSYSSKKGEKGVESIRYHSSNGILEIISHPMLKSGDAFILPLDSLKRVGSTDISFQGEGPEGETSYLLHNQSTNGWTCRAFTDQAIIVTTPAHCCKITNIVPS